ncbi:MAG: sensor histidine kinase [Acidimicrobiia bacterium]
MWGSVRLRITVAATVLVAIGMAAASWLLLATVRSSLRDNQRDQSSVVLTQSLRELNERFAEGYPLNLVPLPPSPLPGYQVVILDSSGRILGGSPGSDSGKFTDIVGNEVTDRIVDERGRPFPNTTTGERHVWFVGDRIYDFVRLPVQVGNTTVPIFLVATGPSGAIDQSVRTLRHTLYWTIPGLITLVGLVAWGVTGRALRPVETIRAEVDSISHSSLDRRVSEPAARDEVGRLARTMNDMLDRLQDASDRQRQFVSDASHELRSPVAALRATGEVALAHPEQTEWPAVVRRMLVEDDRMDRIVSDLLDLARGEETELPDTLVDLDDIALDEAQRARASGLRVDAGRISAGRVRGSREQLVRVVRNLLENGTRHAAGAVRLSVVTDDGTVTLTVEDDGTGIPPEDRERVFERFTRLDEGRARDAGGLGLGLARVRTIAERHGGTAAIVDSTDPAFPGARVVVTLPRAEA